MSSFTIEDLENARHLLEKSTVKKTYKSFYSEPLFGMNVYRNPYLPPKKAKIKLSDKVTVSNEFREDFDKWLADLFGEEDLVYMFDNKLFASPESMQAIIMNTDT